MQSNETNTQLHNQTDIPAAALPLDRVVGTARAYPVTCTVAELTAKLAASGINTPEALLIRAARSASISSIILTVATGDAPEITDCLA